MDFSINTIQDKLVKNPKLKRLGKLWRFGQNASEIIPLFHESPFDSHIHIFWSFPNRIAKTIWFQFPTWIFGFPMYMVSTPWHRDLRLPYSLREQCNGFSPFNWWVRMKEIRPTAYLTSPPRGNARSSELSPEGFYPGTASMISPSQKTGSFPTELISYDSLNY